MWRTIHHTIKGFGERKVFVGDSTRRMAIVMRMRVVPVPFELNTAPVLTGHRENAVTMTRLVQFR